MSGVVAPEFVARALETGLITEDEVEHFLDRPEGEPEPDPDPELEDLVDEPERDDTPAVRGAWASVNAAEHLEHVIHECASGAGAIESINLNIEEVATGRLLPPPPIGATPMTERTRTADALDEVR